MLTGLLEETLWFCEGRPWADAGIGGCSPVLFPAHAAKGDRLIFRKRSRPGSARVNDEIVAKSVRVVGSDGEQVGIMTVSEGLRIAREQELDLVEVAKEADPPVCRIMDYGKYRYEQSKRAKQSRKHQHQVVIKEIRFRPKTDEHDFNFKLKHIREFLESSNKVKVVVRYRGREMRRKEIGDRLLARVIEETKDLADIDQKPRMEGRWLSVMLSPRH